MRKAGYRIEGGEGGDGDQVTLRPDMANHDKYALRPICGASVCVCVCVCVCDTSLARRRYAMEMEWDALKIGKGGKRTGGPMGDRRSVRQRRRDDMDD